MNIKLLCTALFFYGYSLQGSWHNSEQLSNYLRTVRLDIVKIKREQDAKKKQRNARKRSAAAQFKAAQEQKEVDKEMRLPQAKNNLNNEIFAIACYLQDEIARGHGHMKTYKDNSYKACDILCKNECVQNSEEIKKRSRT